MLLIGVSLVFWKIKYASQRAKACTKSLTTIIILFFLVHPALASAVFTIFK